MMIAGVDYSMSNPTICQTKFEDTFSFDKCMFQFLTGKKKLAHSYLQGQIVAKEHHLFNTQEERFYKISLWAISHLDTAEFIVLEDYAFAAKGRVFHIGENTGMLKHQLWRFNKSFVTTPPTVIKKEATGKGNAKKEIMYEAFLVETGCDLEKLFGTKRKDSPISDVVDAFYMCKHAHKLYKQATNGK